MSGDEGGIGAGAQTRRIRVAAGMAGKQPGLNAAQGWLRGEACAETLVDPLDDPRQPGWLYSGG